MIDEMPEWAMQIAEGLSTWRGMQVNIARELIKQRQEGARIAIESIMIMLGHMKPDDV